MKDKREGILHNCVLEGQYCVTFVETIGTTETRTFMCYPTEHKAVLEIGIFKNYDLYKELAKK